jgi:hypothetical protein
MKTAVMTGGTAGFGAVAANTPNTRGIETTELFHCESGTSCRFPGIGARVSGPQPERLSDQSFVSFQDPDGNGLLPPRMRRDRFRVRFD